jgi:hypothetical protein
MAPSAENPLKRTVRNLETGKCGRRGRCIPVVIVLEIQTMKRNIW